VRKIFPAREDVSEFEHPLTKEELHCMSEAFTLENQRVFRLRFIAISQHLHFRPSRLSYVISDWMIRTCPVLGA